MLFQDAPVAEPDLTVVSLGGGIQSTALCLMADQGLLHRKPDVALFADTGWEPPHVYATIQALASLLSFPVETVSNGRNLKEDVRNNVQSEGIAGYISIPAVVRQGQGEVRLGTRQCTRQYKIYPVEQAIRRHLGLAKYKKVKPGTLVHQWFGISYDEVGRMSDNRKPYIQNVYPLIDQKLTRQDCHLWLQKHYPEVPVGKSACFGCPLHSNAGWKLLAEQYPDIMKETIDLDYQIRHHSTEGETFLHTTGIPLDQALTTTGTQESLLDDDCSGYCFG